MKKVLFLLILPIVLSAQTGYIVQKSTTLSGAAEVITVQQPATNSKLVEFKSAYVDCSAACTITLERNGANTPASSTALTIVNINSGETTATATAWYSSNVGTGTVLNVVTVAAGSFIVFDLNGINLPKGGGVGSNLTIRTSSMTGNVNITVKWTER